ncbi:UNVERIFIED_CONTAM: hypothetical protein FKN15_078513 [Acipenser sinensis]
MTRDSLNQTFSDSFTYSSLGLSVVEVSMEVLETMAGVVRSPGKLLFAAAPSSLRRRAGLRKRNRQG